MYYEYYVLHIGNRYSSSVYYHIIVLLLQIYFVVSPMDKSIEYRVKIRACLFVFSCSSKSNYPSHVYPPRRVIESYTKWHSIY